MNISTFIRVLFVTIILSVIIMIVTVLIYDPAKKYFKIKQKEFKKIAKIVKNKILWMLLKETYLHLTTRTDLNIIEFIFHSFCWFYENNYVDMEENWAFPEDFFPEGKKDLTDLYRWIKKTRVDNYNELANLDFDQKNNCFIFWKAKFRSLKHKISSDGELKIIPVEFMESENMERIFQIRIIKIQQDLANLDTEKIKWILERRKFFLI